MMFVWHDGTKAQLSYMVHSLVQDMLKLLI